MTKKIMLAVFIFAMFFAGTKPIEAGEKDIFESSVKIESKTEDTAVKTEADYKINENNRSHVTVHKHGYHHVDISELKEAKNNALSERMIKENENVCSNNSSYVVLDNTDDFTVCFIGDSRFVGIQIYENAYVNDGRSLFVAKVGAGYDWLVSEDTQNAIADINADAYIFNLGVNGFNNPQLYADYVNQFKADHSDAIVIYMSVNPIDDSLVESHGYTEYDYQVIDFNENLKPLLSGDVIWFDTYSVLTQNGYASSDGVHYTSGTNKDIYNMAMNFIGGFYE